MFSDIRNIVIVLPIVLVNFYLTTTLTRAAKRINIREYRRISQDNSIANLNVLLEIF